MPTKTIKYKNLDAKSSQYICTQQDDATCSNCPLRIDIENTNKLHGCYYILKMIMEEQGERTITI